MKRPEYVAVVTKAYRSAIDGKHVTEENMEGAGVRLFRQGFHAGLLRGKIGQDMFGTRQEQNPDKELFAAARATYESGETPRVPVQILCDGARGRARSWPRRMRTGTCAKQLALFPSRLWFIR